MILVWDEFFRTALAVAEPIDHGWLARVRKELVARPEGLEPPAYWFEAGAARKIMNLQRYATMLCSERFQALPEHG